ncbi:MAG: NAD-dependent epimerase/dehydratase family protein [Myxococcota bacterium]
MNVMITGATGFIGSWVVRELVSRGHTVRALVRKTASLANLEGLTLERVEGDVTDRASVARALEGCDAVIHTAGVAHFRPGETERMFAVNEGSVDIVLGQAFERGIKRAVLTASTAVMGGTLERRVADESTPSNAESLGINYFISKYRGEQKAFALAARGFEVCTLRPVVCMGSGDIYHSSATTFKALAAGQMPVFVHGGASFCDVREVAAAHVTALERGRRGEAYILGGHNLEIAEMTRRVAEFAGARIPSAAPYAVAYAVAAVKEQVDLMRGKVPDISRQLIKASRLYTWVKSDKAIAELGYHIRPFEESLRDTLVFFLKQGRLKPSTPQLKALLDAAS